PSTTAGVGAIATSTRSARSSASWALGATTAAIGSPTKRTTLSARIGWLIGTELNFCRSGWDGLSGGGGRPGHDKPPGRAPDGGTAARATRAADEPQERRRPRRSGKRT